jgi:hypothetical protein
MAKDSPPPERQVQKTPQLWKKVLLSRRICVCLPDFRIVDLLSIAPLILAPPSFILDHGADCP